MINRTSDIIHFTNNYTELRLLINYYDMNQLTTYTNDFIDTNLLIEDSLTLSQLNERLKYLSNDRFNISSANIPNLKYSMSTYDITL